jgi:hypothetical protein
MSFHSATESMSPKDKAQYGAALAKGAAFDAVKALWRQRSAEGWTQAQLAESIGVDEGWLSKQFAGPRNWTMETYGMLVVGMDGEAEILAHPIEEPATDLRNYDAYAEYDAPVLRGVSWVQNANTSPVVNPTVGTTAGFTISSLISPLRVSSVPVPELKR